MNRSTYDEMCAEMRRRASRTPAQSIMQGLGDLLGGSSRRGLPRLRVKSPEEAMADDWDAVAADLWAALDAEQPRLSPRSEATSSMHSGIRARLRTLPE